MMKFAVVLFVLATGFLFPAAPSACLFDQYPGTAQLPETGPAAGPGGVRMVAEAMTLPGAGGGESADARPYTRWWWFADVILKQDVRAQLDWLKGNGFGGVELAFVYPLHGDTAAPRLPWLSKEWSDAVTDAAAYCDSIGLGCDITFGTLWPFGDSRVPPEDGALVFSDSTAPKRMRLTWEHPLRGRVVNHLDRNAFDRYSARMFNALAPALQRKPRHLFCDSWEVETRGLWTRGFDVAFESAYHYDIRPMMDSLYTPGFEDVHYDYMKLLSQYVIEMFYGPLTESAHSHGAETRVQCCGSPTDLLAAYGRVDVPESEAILYEPAFSRIPASAAALYGKRLVSAEAFTCLYGWKGWPGPGPHQGEERISDMKLLADAMFAHGVNWIVWHGMPFNPPGRNEKFYAAVHVGPDAGFADGLPEFNRYLSEISAAMRKGRSYSDVAVYLPLEDAWMGVELPDSLKMPWAWGEYELRYQRIPDELKGYQPLWINSEALSQGTMHNGRLRCGDTEIRVLYVDAQHLDLETLRAITGCAEEGLQVCILQRPSQPGFRKDKAYPMEVDRLLALPTVQADDVEILQEPPLVEGENIPDFWCRSDNGTAWLFFAHPASQHLKYPLTYGQSDQAIACRKELRINWNEKEIPITLDFPAGASILVEVRADGIARQKTYILSSP